MNRYTGYGYSGHYGCSGTEGKDKVYKTREEAAWGTQAELKQMIDGNKTLAQVLEDNSKTLITPAVYYSATSVIK